MNNEVKEFTKLKNQLEKANSKLEVRVEELELKCQTLETDMEISQQERDRLIQEAEEFKTLGKSFRTVIEDLTKRKEKEATALQEQIESLTEKLCELEKENKTLTTSKKKCEEYINFVKSMNYEEKTSQLEASLNKLQDENRKLKEEIIQGISLHQDLSLLTVSRNPVECFHFIIELNEKRSSSKRIKERRLHAKNVKRKSMKSLRISFEHLKLTI